MSSGEAGRRRLHRGDGTPVMEPAVKRQKTAEDAGQGSSRAPGLKASRPLIRVLVINDNGLWINDFHLR